MGTSNFGAHNTRSICAVGLSDTDAWYWDDLSENIRQRAKKMGITLNASPILKEYEWIDNETKLITEEEDDFPMGKFDIVEIRIQIVQRSGYYEGAMIDYRLFVHYDYNDYEIEDEDFEVLDDVMDEIEEYIINYEPRKLGMFRIHRDRYKSALKKRLEDEIERLNGFCESVCDDKLAVCARFSNGETWYSKV